MTIRSILAAPVAALLALLPAAASAAPLPPGGVALAPFGTAPESGTLVAQLLNQPPFPPDVPFGGGPVLGRLSSSVFREADGSYDFTYKLDVLAGSIPVGVLFVPGFDERFHINILDVRVSGPGVVPNLVAYIPSLGNMPSLGVVEFLFEAQLLAGQSSATMILNVAPAPGPTFAYAPATAYFFPSDTPTYFFAIGPTGLPEPPSALLLAPGLAASLALAGRRRR
jgi:hypothetical protein